MPLMVEVALLKAKEGSGATLELTYPPINAKLYMLIEHLGT